MDVSSTNWIWSIGTEFWISFSDQQNHPPQECGNYLLLGYFLGSKMKTHICLPIDKFWWLQQDYMQNLCECNHATGFLWAWGGDKQKTSPAQILIGGNMLVLTRKLADRDTVRPKQSSLNAFKLNLYRCVIASLKESICPYVCLSVRPSEKRWKTVWM